MVNESSVPLMTVENPLSSSQLSVSSVQELPEDILATMHFTYGPMVKKSLPKLSKKELSRVVEAIIDIPPSQKTLNAFNQAQKNVYFTLEKVLMSKYFMMYTVAIENEVNKSSAQQQPPIEEQK